MKHETYLMVDDLIGQISWKFKREDIQLTYEELRGELWEYYLSTFGKNEDRGAYLNVCFTRKSIDIIRRYSRRTHDTLVEGSTSEIQEVNEAYSFIAIAEIISLFEHDKLCCDYIISKLNQLKLQKYIPLEYKARSLELDEIIGDTERSMSLALISDHSYNYKWRNMKKTVQSILQKLK